MPQHHPPHFQQRNSSQGDRQSNSKTRPPLKISQNQTQLNFASNLSFGKQQVPPNQQMTRDNRQGKMVYQDNFHQDNQRTSSFTKGNSFYNNYFDQYHRDSGYMPKNNISARQVVPVLQMNKQVSKEELKQKADIVKRQFEEELLSKFRQQQPDSTITNTNTGSTNLASSSKKQSLVPESSEKLKQNLIAQANTIDLSSKDHLNLEKESSESSIQIEIEDEQLIFKDMTKTHSPMSVNSTEDKKGKLNFTNNEHGSSSIIELEGDIEITSQHLKSAESSPTKHSASSFFKNRNLNYNGSDTSSFMNIQKSFDSKYFKDTGSSIDLKSLVKNNSFLLQNKAPPLPSKVKKVQNAQPPPKTNLTLDNAADMKELQAFIRKKKSLAIKQQEEKKKAELEQRLKEKELLKKKKIKQAKLKQEMVLNELFGVNEKEEGKGISSNLLDMLADDQDGLGGLLEDEDKDEHKSEGEEEDNDENQDQNSDPTFVFGRNLEEIQRQKQHYEWEEKMRLIRFKNRWNVDELIQPLLNLEIIDMFCEEGKGEPDQSQFPILPKVFESSQDYFNMWLKLFTYETYNQLLNKRNDSDKDKEMAKMFGLKMKNDNQSKNFTGLLQKYQNNQKFVYLKLWENDNHNGKTSSAVTGNYTTPYPHLDSLKDFDLLLLSEQDLGTINIKQLTSVQYLKDIQNKQGTFMAMVDGKLDIRHEKYINVHLSEFEKRKMHVYFFDSMSTRIREFRTVKSVEFFPNSQFILDPTLIPQQVVCEQAADQGKKTPERLRLEMVRFIDAHQDKFNESQKQALHNVSKMNNVDFLLIQGPPGTGKTHTIKGIISMLNFALQDNKKIMVCAPSNAAIDEIVTRLITKDGLFGSNVKDSIKKVLRIGHLDYEPSETVQKVMFTTKMMQNRAQLETKEEKAKFDEQRDKWKNDIQKIDECIRAIDKTKNLKQVEKLVKAILYNPDKSEKFMNFDKQKQKEQLQIYQNELKTKLRQQEENRRNNGQDLTKAQRILLEQKIIQQTQIICTTLAMSTNDKLEYIQNGDIDYLIVDEACQSVELNNLIPFEHQPRKIILVGDQQQLPATTFSENADKTKYSRSLFERFLECGVDHVMLEIQYRMHPLIRQFPSSQFYNNRLRDDISINTRVPDSNLMFIQDNFNVLRFFDLSYSMENSSETSKVNNDEVEFVESFINQIISKLAKHLELSSNPFAQNFVPRETKETSLYMKKAAEKIKGMIGIISPYKSQVRELKNKIYGLLKREFDISTPQNYVEINTVDAFQGREKDIIVFSCVRSSKERQLGFISDYRRMNVAITRARHCLYVVGNSNTLFRDQNWKSFIEYCMPSNYVEYSKKEDALPNSKPQVPSSPLVLKKPVIEKPIVQPPPEPASVKPVPQLRQIIESPNLESLGLAGLLLEDELDNKQDVRSKVIDAHPVKQGDTDNKSHKQETSVASNKPSDKSEYHHHYQKHPDQSRAEASDHYQHHNQPNRHQKKHNQPPQRFHDNRRPTYEREYQYEHPNRRNGVCNQYQRGNQNPNFKQSKNNPRYYPTERSRSRSPIHNTYQRKRDQKEHQKHFTNGNRGYNQFSKRPKF